MTNDWDTPAFAGAGFRRLASRRVYKLSGGANVSLLNYSYDNSDNMTGIADAVVAARSTTYAYDSVERLNRVDGNLAGG